MGANGVSLECHGVSYWYPGQKVLHEVDLKVFRGEIVAIVGETGAGKSTLLNLILGTVHPKRGEVVVHATDGTRHSIREPGPDRGVVYQQYSLYPFKTALGNVLMGLDFDHPFPCNLRFFDRSWRQHRRRHREEAVAILEKVKLGDALDKYPHELSGGMRQRVAIAQALVKKPEILLLDEPFGALDEITRRELQMVLLEFYWENCRAKRRGESPPYTILIVTHELEEAILVADRVIGLSPHWHWEVAGHAECPGARIVYDKVAQVDLPDRDSKFELLAKQRSELRDAVFSRTALKNGANHVVFEQEIADGGGRGIFDENGMNFDFLTAPKAKISHDGQKARRIYV